MASGILSLFPGPVSLRRKGVPSPGRLGWLNGGSILRYDKRGLCTGGCGLATRLGPILFLQRPVQSRWEGLVDRGKAGAELHSPVPVLGGWGEGNRIQECPLRVPDFLVNCPKPRKGEQSLYHIGQGLGWGGQSH